MDEHLPIELEVTVTSRDYYEANKLHYFRILTKFGKLLAVILDINIVVWGAFILWAQDYVSGVFLLLWLLILFPLYPYSLMAWSSKALYKKHTHYKKPTNIRLDQEGITETTCEFTIIIKWESFKSCCFNDKILSIYFSPVRFILIPKSAVSDEDWKKVIGFVVSKVGVKQ